jgi:lysophospholipase L1-like esterase
MRTPSPVAAAFLAVLLAAAASGCADDGGGSTSGGGSGTGIGGGEGSGGSPSSGPGPGPGPGGGDDPSSISSSGSGGSPASASASASGTGGGPPVGQDVHVVARTHETEGGAPRFTWSGSAVRTRIDGTGLQVTLDAPAGIWFEVEVDGASIGSFPTSGGVATYTVVEGLPPGEHAIELVRRNEGFYGGTTVVDVVPMGIFVPTPPRDRRIELIGDSLTAGYGVLDLEPCDFSAATESAYAAYGGVAARALGADAHMIAFSGKGVVQNYGGDTSEPMPVLWPRTLTGDASLAWDFSRYQPQVVVLNLGTNDFSAPIDDGAFVDGYALFLAEIRAAHPEAHVLCVTWAHWGAASESLVSEAVIASGLDRVSTTRFVIDPDEGYGCDFHTSDVANARLGAELAATLRATLGWD